MKKLLFCISLIAITTALGYPPKKSPRTTASTPSSTSLLATQGTAAQQSQTESVKLAEIAAVLGGIRPNKDGDVPASIWLNA